MTDGEYTLLMLLGLVTLCAVYLFAIVRSQKKTIAQLTAQALRPVAAGEAPPESSSEVETLRKRVQVLERIATDGNSTIEREFEELRDR